MFSSISPCLIRSNVYRFALLAGFAHDDGAVAGGILGQTFDRDHEVEQCHVVTVRDSRRRGGLADHPHLAAVGPDDDGDHDGDDGVRSTSRRMAQRAQD